MVTYAQVAQALTRDGWERFELGDVPEWLKELANGIFEAGRLQGWQDAGLEWVDDA